MEVSLVSSIGGGGVAGTAGAGGTTGGVGGTTDSGTAGVGLGGGVTVFNSCSRLASFCSSPCAGVAESSI